MDIKFSPPDIREEDIKAVEEVLRSGWITTGLKVREFENDIATFCKSEKAVAFNSATAALEMTLRMLGVGKGDEVITSAYTYTASASVIEHVGAKIVLVDTYPDSYFMDLDKLEKAINKHTKVIIPVDIGGIMCDYDKIYEIIERKRNKFRAAKNEFQMLFNRIIVLADGAHSLGATYYGRPSGSVADYRSRAESAASSARECWDRVACLQQEIDCLMKMNPHIILVVYTLDFAEDSVSYRSEKTFCWPTELPEKTDKKVKIKGGRIYQCGSQYYYLKKDAEVIALARKKKTLDRVLEAAVPGEIYDELEKMI